MTIKTPKTDNAFIVGTALILGGSVSIWSHSSDNGVK